jgi:DNA-binding NarL/FixJ family response regulator
MFCPHVPVKFFLADDSSLIRDHVVAMLGGGAIAIVGQSQTQGSIDGLLAAMPDVMVRDVQLDGGFGREVLRAVRQVAADIVFVMFSNNASPAYRKRYALEGAGYFLDKRTEFDQLSRAVVNAAQQSAY